MDLMEFLVEYSPYITVGLLIIALFVNAWAAIYFVRCRRKIEKLHEQSTWQEKSDQLNLSALRTDHDAQLEAQRLTYETQIAGLQQTINTLQDSSADLRRQHRALFSEHERLRQFVSNVDSECLSRFRARWLSYLSDASFPTIEVLAYKLALPLVIFLGYSLDDINLEPTVRLVGVTSKARISNWVVSARRADNTIKGQFLLQLVETPERLTDQYLAESGQVALVAKVYKYVVTNGRDFYICTRSAPYDLTTLDCKVDSLGKYWDRIENALAVTRLMP